ncbi:DNA-binding protein [Marinobacter sp.]|jgi:hypothetical protein|uniref:DNA-binding protein n=1 Tax=Marinobacter sp. TaxID=50741 RepID=UPI001995D646|nr:DNA-binding protein [Marinobacter sp.]MBC7192128.1 DNA-binding protein [Marinobacter sp.]
MFEYTGLTIAGLSHAGSPWLLADHDSDLDALVERLGTAGCDDALAGVEQPGRLALEFFREAGSAEELARTALAGVVGISRQAMRKLMLAHRATFLMPVHEGSASIWHPAEILDWLRARGGYEIDTGIQEIAQVALEVNITKEAIRHPMSRQGNKELLTAQPQSQLL